MSAEDLNIGRLVAARYRLDDLLGRGGFGSVYRGWDTQIGRDVAVKLLDVANRARSTQQTAELRERFRREAMAAGRINHRGVVTIYDFGIPEDGGEAFLVMELLEGHDLAAELAQNGPMLPDRVQRLFVPMLEALGQGHALGIVHKDIKPQNVFLTHPGEPNEAFSLVDFGVARVVHEDKLTMTGLIVGTPQYMAPEYITDTLVTPALDVYQMGLILVESITGVPAVPSGESFVKSCNRHFTGELEVPPQLKEGEFGQVLQMALRPNPVERLPDGTRFAEMLAAVDPSTIVIDGQSTMVFTRTPVRDLAEPTLFPPMRPEQASAELEREQDSGQFTAAPNTPLGTARLPLSAPVTAPESNLTVAPPPTTSPHEPPASSHAPLIVIAILLLLAVGAVSVAIGLTADVDAPADPAPPVPVAAIETPPPPVEIRVEPVAMTLVSSEPAGAKIMVNGVEVGLTPRELPLESGSAELHLDGYDVAVVELAPGLPSVVLQRRAVEEAPVVKASNSSPTPPPKKFVGRVFIPEDIEDTETAEAPAKDEPPAKFESKANNAKKERWDLKEKTEVEIAQ